MSHKHSNNLVHESSPYLLQHAHNPVNWYPWSDEALKKAREENKPILVSIGYSACHWCHVMERESFEDETTAAIMNEHFINIKIDREERPDLDHIYMDAVQAMSGGGGWPLNVFLTPEGKPFYGGTYFPPKRAFNRPSWQEILQGVTQAFKDRRQEIDAQAENLTDHLRKSNSFGLQPATEPEQVFSNLMINEAVENVMKQADRTWGGFGKAPKFPQTFTIQFLLRNHFVSGKTSNPSGVDVALLSLDKMIEGGIYDQLGGGFARYATDTEWLAPHFEKMLYDNALLVSVISEAYQLTGKERYKEVIEETMEFIQRELMHPQVGFYAALDADSEGVEGKFYVWSKKEIDELLGDDAAIISEYYDVSEQGNWEGKNILRVKKSPETFVAAKKMNVDSLKQLLKKATQKLLPQRSKRIHPQLDDKIILGWNALMNTASSKAFAATGNEKYRQLAISNMQFLLSKFRKQDTHEFNHTWKNDIAKYPAFLDDYAFLIQALIQLQEITADKKWLLEASAITEFVIENFYEENDVKSNHGNHSNEEGTHFFYYTKTGQPDIIVRKKEVYDGAVPSGNSVMALNLHQLSILFDRKDWKEISLHSLASLSRAIVKYPSSFGNWACLLLEIISGTSEIAITGKPFQEIHKELLRVYLPHRVLMVSENPDPGFPLLAEKPGTQPPSIWLCRKYSCQRPETTIKGLISLIDRAG